MKLVFIILQHTKEKNLDAKNDAVTKNSFPVHEGEICILTKEMLSQ